MSAAASHTPGESPSELGATSRASSRDSRDDRPLLLPGDLVDNRYRIERVIGHGGMGVVYQAEHIAIARPVAIKLLHAQLAALPEVRSRFEREALAIGRISHTNCVDISDFGRLADGSLFLVMEFLNGKPLTEYLHHGPLPVEQALRILKHVLRGLAHAHANGIVHRDVKPANVFVVQSESDPTFAKIVDFGIAKLVGPTDSTDVNLTQAGVAFGTPVYMSPEQTMGEPADGRSDLYSASVVAYELFAGAPPFMSDDKLELMGMHATKAPPPLHAVRDTFFAASADPLPPAAVVELDALVRRGLEKRPAARYPSAQAYLQAVERLEAQLPDLANGMPPRTTVKKRIVLAVAVMVALACLGWLLIPRPQPLPKPAPNTPAGKAAAQLERGNPTAAIATVRRAKDATQDPLAQAQLGHALASTRDYRGALAAYERAISLDPRVKEDPTLLANLATMAAEPEPTTKLLAWRFGTDVLKSEDQAATFIAAATADDARLRAQARALLETHALSSQVDWLASYVRDLQSLPSCAERRGAIARLRALGSPKAILPLQAASAAKGNKCLAADALSAVRFLRHK